VRRGRGSGGHKTQRGRATCPRAAGPRPEVHQGDQASFGCRSKSSTKGRCRVAASADTLTRTMVILSRPVLGPRGPRLARLRPGSRRGAGQPSRACYGKLGSLFVIVLASHGFSVEGPASNRRGSRGCRAGGEGCGHGSIDLFARAPTESGGEAATRRGRRTRRPEETTSRRAQGARRGLGGVAEPPVRFGSSLPHGTRLQQRRHCVQCTREDASQCTFHSRRSAGRIADCASSAPRISTVPSPTTACATPPPILPRACYRDENCGPSAPHCAGTGCAWSAIRTQTMSAARLVVLDGGFCGECLWDQHCVYPRSTAMRPTGACGASSTPSAATSIAAIRVFACRRCRREGGRGPPRPDGFRPGAWTKGRGGIPGIAQRVLLPGAAVTSQSRSAWQGRHAMSTPCQGLRSNRSSASRLSALLVDTWS